MTMEPLGDPRQEVARRGAAGGRYATILGGAALACVGLWRGGWSGAALTAAGGGILLAGAAGPDALRRLRDGDLAAALPIPDHAPRTTQSVVTIGAPAERIFRFWRNVANLTRLFPGLERVAVDDAVRSTWTARVPGGGRVRWRSVIDKEQPDVLIAWRTLDGADLPHRGSLTLRAAPGDRGTEARLTIRYRPPGGRGGRTVAALLGVAPERQSREALRRLKQIMEVGAVSTIDGQPRGVRGVREVLE